MALTLERYAEAVLEIFPVIIREFLRQPNMKVAKIPLTVPQLFIMDYLYRHDRSKMKDLAGFMNVTMATMTGIVDRLVRDGYAARTIDANDRRVVSIVLSAKGMALAKKIHQIRREGIMHLFQKISTKDRANYLKILSLIRDACQKGTNEK